VKPRTQKMYTKAMYEKLLNDIGTPEHDHPRNGGRVSFRSLDKYGTWLRRYDPLAFDSGYQDWKYEHERMKLA
jgi:hypothetical protein